MCAEIDDQQEPVEVPTAYSQASAEDYDARRFQDPHGRLFAGMEESQFCKVLDTLAVPRHVLEVGCGTGRFLRMAAGRGHEVCGVDPSPHMLKIAEEKIGKNPRARFVRAEGAALPFPDEAFDFVYAIRTINQVASKDYALAMLRELFRVCRAGGDVLVEFVNSKSLNADGRSTVISVRDIEDVCRNEARVRVAHVSGILFWSLTVLNLTPRPLLGLYEKVDTFFATRWPRFCTRCYVHLKKD